MNQEAPRYLYVGSESHPGYTLREVVQDAAISGSESLIDLLGYVAEALTPDQQDQIALRMNFHRVNPPQEAPKRWRVAVKLPGGHEVVHTSGICTEAQATTEALVVYPEGQVLRSQPAQPKP